MPPTSLADPEFAVQKSQNEDRIDEQIAGDPAPAFAADESALVAHQRTIIGGGFAGAATLLSVSNFGLRLLSLATTAVLARVLVPADYGIVALAATVTGFLDVLTNVQVYGSLIRAEHISEEQLRTGFTLDFLRGLSSAVLIFVLAHQLASVMGDARLGPILQVLALVPLMNGLHNPVFVLYERKLQFMPNVTRTFVANLLGTVTSIVLALMWHSYWALVVSTLVITATHMAMTYWRVPIRIGFSFSHFKEMFGFGGWLALVSVIEYMNGRIDVLLVGRGLGTALLGGYQAGGQIMAVATGDVVGPLVRAIFPALALTKNREELRRKYIRIQAIILSLTLPIGMGLSALATEIVLVFLGPRWTTAIPVVAILAPVIALQTMLATVDAVAMTTGRTRSLFKRTTAVFVVRVILLCAGFYLAGFMGVIVARVFSGAFYLVYGLLLAARLTDTPIWAPIANSWRSLVSAGAMFALLKAWSWRVADANFSVDHLIVETAFRIAVGAGAYVAIHFLLWSLSARPEGVERTFLEHLGRLQYRLRNGWIRRTVS